MKHDESDGIETRVGFTANYRRAPSVRIDVSSLTRDQIESLMVELERQSEEARIVVLADPDEKLR